MDCVGEKERSEVFPELLFLLCNFNTEQVHVYTHTSEFELVGTGFLRDRHHAVRLRVKWRFSGCRVCNSHFLFACPTGFNYSREQKERVSRRRESEMKIRTGSLFALTSPTVYFSLVL